MRAATGYVRSRERCGNPSRDGVIAGMMTLSPRQREVFDLLLLGYTESEAGKFLGITVATVQSHKSMVAFKLGMEDARKLPWNLCRILLGGN